MELTEKDIQRVQNTIRNVSSYDFSDYSYNSFCRRIEKIVGDYGMTVEELIKDIQNDYNFMERVVRDITVNTTEFFRDTDTWHKIRSVFSNRFADKESLDIWHAGCSSGQEVYSMMIMLSELGLFDRASIYATDINENVLKTAMSGQYKYHEVQDYLGNFDKVFNHKIHSSTVPYVDIRKYMEINKLKDYVKMDKNLIEKPLFFKHDLVSGEPIINKPLDIIVCRNVLIYFNHDLQNKVLKFFHSNLAENGCLIIGRHEGMIGHVASLFEKKDTLYFKRK